METNFTPCPSEQLVGETVVEIVTPATYPCLHRLGVTYAYAMRMASGKVFTATPCFGGVCFARVSPDMAPTVWPPRDPVREGSWVVFLGRNFREERTFMKYPSHNTTTTDLNEAFGWSTETDALQERDIQLRSWPDAVVGRVCSFR